MLKSIRSNTCFFLCCLLSQSLYADIRIDAATKVLRFNYEEFDLSGKSLNKETGFLPGFSISSTKALASTSHTISFELYDGQVDYDGQTQSGVPHTTLTDETLYRLFYKLNWFPSEDGHSIYTKVSWQQWDRDILPANNVSGLYEQYQWLAFEVGFSVAIYEKNANTWLLDLGAAKVFDGSIMVDLETQGFGKPKLQLGNGSGFSAALMYQRSLNQKSNLSLTLTHQYWTFGRSNDEAISDGVTTLIITEPRSESNHTALSLHYSYHF